MKMMVCMAAIALLCLVSGCAMVKDRVKYSGSCGSEGDGSNLKWTLTRSGVLTISGRGTMQDGGLPWSMLNDYGDAISVRWNTLSLLEEEAQKWPRLAKGLKKFSEEADRKGQAAYSNMQEQLQSSLRYEQENLGYDPDGEVPQEWYLALDGWPYYLSMRLLRRKLRSCRSGGNGKGTG